MAETPRKSFLPVIQHVLNGIVLVLIVYYGIWFTSDAHFPIFHALNNYYVNFSQALREGQVALLDQPDPRLAGLADPHLAIDSDIPFLWDVSYFRNKYYIYWGPIPVISYLIYETLLGKPAPAQLGLLAAYCGIACVFVCILYMLRRKFFPRAPVFTIGIFLLAACINPPYAFLLSRPLTYETSILTAQLFLLLGISFWALFLIYKKSWLLSPAGLAWGLAVLARYVTVISVAIYTGIALLYLWKTRLAAESSEHRQVTRKAILLILPLGACALALGIYNIVRFGSPLETGLRYQLTNPVQAYFSADFFPSNLYTYLLYPNQIEHFFPFVRIGKFQPADLPTWAATAPGKQFDYGFFGLFHSLPLAWYATLAWIALPVTSITHHRSAKKQANILRACKRITPHINN